MKYLIAFLIGMFTLFPSLLPFAQSSNQSINQKMSLDFTDADVRNILRLIAEAANLNIVVGNKVKGKITIKLVNVSWEQALRVILQSQSLGMIRTGNVIRIASLEELRKEEEIQLASKRSKEKIEDLKIEIIHLKYAIAKDIIPIVKILLSERGAVSADQRTNTLIIKDIPENIEAIKNLFR